MKIILLPNTNLYVSKFGFGCSSLHRKFWFGDQKRIIYGALDTGITHFDTAASYGMGGTEGVLGRILRGSRDHISLATKFGIDRNLAVTKINQLRWLFMAKKVLGKSFKKNSLESEFRDFSLKNASQSLHLSLRQLGTDRVEIFFVHDPRRISQFVLEDLVTWAEQQKQLGKIRYFGISGDIDVLSEIELVLLKQVDVLQTEDCHNWQSLRRRMNGYIDPQITFGYLRNMKINGYEYNADEVLKMAIKRNTRGCILVSSSKISNIKKLSQIL